MEHVILGRLSAFMVSTVVALGALGVTRAVGAPAPDSPATAPTASSKDQYRPLEGLNARIVASSPIAFDADGYLNGKIDGFVCEGKKVELVSTEVKDGWLETKEFGKIRLQNEWDNLCALISSELGVVRQGHWHPPGRHAERAFGSVQSAWGSRMCD